MYEPNHEKMNFYATERAIIYVTDDLLAKDEIQNSASAECFYGLIKDKVPTSHIFLILNTRHRPRDLRTPAMLEDNF